MKKKKILKITLTLILCVVLFVAIENVIRYVYKSHLKKQKENEYINSIPQISQTQAKREEELVSVTNEIVQLLKDRKYEEVYAYFSDIYIDAKYPRYEDFKEKMDSILTENASVEVQDLVKYSNYYYAVITVDGEEVIELAVKYDENQKVESVTVENIISIYKANYKCYTDNVTLNLAYAINYLDHIGYVFEIINESNEKVNFNFEESYLETTGLAQNKKYDVKEKGNNIQIGAKETKRVEVEFPVAYSIKMKPDKMYLSFNINEDTYNYTFDISFWNEYFSM